MMIQAEQVRQMRDRLNQIFADATGQSLERIEAIPSAISG